MFDVIKQLCALHAPTGRETELCSFLSEQAGGFSARADRFGNFLIHKAGSGKRVLVSAPMDETSFVVNRVSGCFSYFETIGAQPVSAYLGKRVFVGGRPGVVGCCPVHLSGGDRNAFPKADTLYFQTAAPCERGDFGTLDGEYGEYGEENSLMRGRAVCDRSAMAAMLGLLTAHTECDLYLVFASCGKAGAAGVKAAAELIRPELAVLLQPFANDGALDSESPAKVAVPFIDSGAVHNRELIDFANAVAARHGIDTVPPKARQTAPASAISQLAGGIRTLMLSIPGAYLGTVSETCRKKDVEALLTLLGEILSNPAA